MRAKTVMVQGTASSVGKSLLVTALCRILRRHGYSVAPFKSQNMSLNSFVTKEGHEIGRAQAVQAKAAGIEPSVLMNPLLLKPTTTRESQIILNGQVHGVMAAAEYYQQKHRFRPAVETAFSCLAARHDVIVIEGAGSPAEINLQENDFVNMGMAIMADAPVLLAGDIDRGGVFASLYGTVMLVPKAERSRIKGLIINKFRGDAGILAPGVAQLEAMLGLPVLGVLPYEPFAIDDEDSLTDRLGAGACATTITDESGDAPLRIVIPRLPRIANFTDFAALDAISGCIVIYAQRAEDFAGADLVILPGSKSTVSDLLFLRETGMEAKILELARMQVPLIGICGGFQMLGRSIHDPHGVEGSAGSCPGLGLLDMETVFEAEKLTIQATHTLHDCPGILKGTAGMALSGYEIHMGRPIFGPKAFPLACTDKGDGFAGATTASAMVFGTYLHGLFDNLSFTRMVINQARTLRGLNPNAKGDSPTGQYATLQDQEYDRLADMVERYLDMEQLFAIIGLSSGGACQTS